MRPRWKLRLGLFLYDHIGGRRRLPPTRSVRLDHSPLGAALKPQYRHAFEYSDCWVEDSRLVVLNARDAADRGAVIAPRTSCVSAERVDGEWDVTLREASGAARKLRCKVLVNAAGPWVGNVLGGVVRSNTQAHLRLVKGSHIVVPRLYAHDRCYIFQNADGRIFFAIPYERDFTLIGTTDQDYTGDPADVRISPGEIAYLCAGASEYFRVPVTPEAVVWTYSGVRPLYDDHANSAQAATREYVLALDAPEGQGALLSVFGGKITTFRRLAEAALAKLAPHLPQATGLQPGWTATASLPGGDFPLEGFDTLLAETMRRWPFLAPATARRLVRAYGTRVGMLLGDARDARDLGRVIGADLTEAEIRYLAAHEWAMRAEDIVWRRSKLGLRLSPAEIAAIDTVLLAGIPSGV